MYLKYNKFHLYYVKNEYIDYLREFDKKVFYNKNQKRPYIGIICIFQNQKYFVSMSSPKEKHMNLNPNLVDIYKISEGKLGILNINNMIPIPDNCIMKLDFNKEEETYIELLKKQIVTINDDKDKILLKISKFFTLYKTNKLYENILKRTCDFELLNQKCTEWKNKDIFEVHEDEEQYNFNENDYRVWAY